jgi:hypothetical protein
VDHHDITENSGTSVLAEHVAAMLQAMLDVLTQNVNQRPFVKKDIKLQNSPLMNVVALFPAQRFQSKIAIWLFVQRQQFQLVNAMKMSELLLLMLDVVVMIMNVNAIRRNVPILEILHVQRDTLELMLMIVVVAQYHDVVLLTPQPFHQLIQQKLSPHEQQPAHIPQHHVSKNQSVLITKVVNEFMVNLGHMKIHVLSTLVMMSRTFELLSNNAPIPLHAQRE